MAEIFVIVIFFILLGIAATVLFFLGVALRRRKLDPSRRDIELPRRAQRVRARDARRPEHTSVENEQHVETAAPAEHERSAARQTNGAHAKRPRSSGFAGKR